jgi:hypothetical protein
MQVLVQAFVDKLFPLQIQPTDDITLLKQNIQKTMILPDEQCSKVENKRIEETDDITNCLTDNDSRVPLLRIVHSRCVHRDSVCATFHEIFERVSRMMPFPSLVTFPDLHLFY